MALKPTIKACSVENCTGLRITDTTGAYNNPDNLTGWGSPNIDPSDAGFSAEIIVNDGDPIDMLNYGFPTSTVITTPESPAFYSTSSAPPLGTFSLKVEGITMSDPFTLVFGDSDALIAFKIQTAIDTFGSGFSVIYSGGVYIWTAPVGSGTTYNGLFGIIGTFPIIPLVISYDDGVDQVNAVINGPVTGDFTFDDIEVDLPDGWNTITYTLDTTATSPVSVTIKIFTYCKIKCCVFNKMLEMNDFDICKDSERIASLMHMWNLYNSMLYSANGCGESQATEILTRLQQLCEVDDTTSGCGCS